MSISLSYMSDLSRVRISLSGLPDGAVLVERSLQQTLWDTVRGGRELPVSGGSAGLDDYEFYAGQETHYRVSPVDPPAGLLLPGTGADDASTPDSAALDITGDLDVRALITPDSWTPSADGVISAKYQFTDDQRSWRFELTTAGALRLGWSETGASDSTNVDEDSTAAVPDDDATLAVRATLDVDNGSSEHTVTFYTAPDLSGPWTQLGDPVTNSGAVSIHAGTADLQVGNWGNGSRPFAGVIQAVEVRDGVGGTVVADPDFADLAGGTTSFDDDQGNTWTVGGDAEIVGTWSDSITVNLADVWLKSIRYPLLNRTVRVLHRGEELTRADRSGLHQIVGRAAPVGTAHVHGARTWAMVLRPADADEAAALELALSASTLWLVHVPATTTVPGGYVQIGEVVRRQETGGAPHTLHVPCSLVAPPGPDVTGTTLTWGTVRRLYGDSWAAVIAAHPDWADLLATVGDPEDTVVI